MIKTLGKAFYWKRLIDEGRYPTMRRLAPKREPGLGPKCCADHAGTGHRRVRSSKGRQPRI